MRLTYKNNATGMLLFNYSKFKLGAYELRAFPEQTNCLMLNFNTK